ncbi:MAG TPA: nitrate reductase subunit alpha, partial [Woeseiaceae bacterium]|nr:nitrate reductase subunit alpha [Woeseiaceae bacterium]
MSHFLDQLAFFRREKTEFADGHGVTTNQSRRWEDSYRQRWQHDKIVRSTHGVNCTGSCSWKIYVKNGLVTWETQQTDYPRTRPDLPNHEPRGCARGASFSWYIYSANRVKYPMIRRRLLELWREALKIHDDPVVAWRSIQEDSDKVASYRERRGLGGFVRAHWDEVNEIIAAANVYTARRWGPDRIVGFSPIPAMSMVSYAAGTRYLSLIGGTCLSFYDWYCDLPPASPQTWGEQTDVPESADWFNSTFLMMWGSNVPQTRTPDAHFMTEARYRGTKVVTVSPDYSEAAKFGDIWLNPKQGSDSAMAMAMGHVIFKEWHVDGRSDYFDDYVRRYTDLPNLVLLDEHSNGHMVPGRYLRASDLVENAGQSNNAEWKTLAYDEHENRIVVPRGSIGFRWGEQQKCWNLEARDATGEETKLALSQIERADEAADVGFPYFDGGGNAHWAQTEHDPIQVRKVPVRLVELATGQRVRVASVFDLMAANYAIDRGLGGSDIATGYDDDVPYTPAWQERITGVSREKVISVARQFAENAHKTHGKSMIVIGAGMNHWYNMDMGYRGVIKMLMMCGCIGVSGGGWAHYVGQEKLRPQTGWLPLAFALDWHRPPRQMNGTSFFYSHSDQWRYEKLDVSEILSPLADASQWGGSMIDYNVRAEHMGWLPSAPQFDCNPLDIGRDAAASGDKIEDYVVDRIKSGELGFACEDPDNPANFPRNMFVWRSNLLGSSGKGHEYLLRHLLGTENGVQGKDLGDEVDKHPKEVRWREPVHGKLDLLVTLDFRMSTTCMYSDIVLPTATWYEKHDLNTSDMHPFIHPLTAAVDPVWESRSDFNIYKGLAKRFSELAKGHLGKETDVVSVPLLHDTPGELGQAMGVANWKRGECDPVPGRTMPSIVAVERDYPATFDKFTALGPLLDDLGNGGKGIHWETQDEVDALGDINGRQRGDGVNGGRPKIETARDACETILMLAPETNGNVAVKAWESLSKSTGREHAHLAQGHAAEKIRFADIVAQPRKIYSSPIWSGIESSKVSYTAGWTNINELIPWRTLTGRQQFYQDHDWMRAFGEQLCVYKPPVDLKTIDPIKGTRDNGNPEIVLNFITPHQKWGIHSTYTDNLLMLTLSRGGPIIWMSETDAARAGIRD